MNAKLRENHRNFRRGWADASGFGPAGCVSVVTRTPLGHRLGCDFPHFTMARWAAMFRS
ncbi:MAG: hypothetical protein K2Z80_02385 [Xanthobacteraceae bacterium]|nr:hypothetical protein [Xanthobacteraceae bacterium]